MTFRALWWWIDRWRKSTAYTDMTLEEQGAYRNLLDEATLRGGPLPTDEHALSKACGDPRTWKRIRAKVMGHFYLAPDGWRNETLDTVLARSEELRVARSEAGRQGGLAKASKHPSKTPSKTPSKPLANEVANEVANTLAKTCHPYQSPSEELKAVKAAAPPRRPIADDKGTPEENLPIITALVGKELIPLGIIADELIEATKSACATRQIAYDSQTVRKAVDSALARQRKAGF